ncbi:putative ribosome-binding factor A, mitochondrial [Pelodytes ibericus]
MCIRVLSSGDQHRPIHLSPALPAKNMLRKFASKTKKKFWYDSPSLGSQFVKKPENLLSLMKVPKKQKREDSIRIRALNSIMYKALTNLLQTPEVSEAVYNLNVELSKVCLSVDFSVCRAYWITSGVAETDNQVEEVLQKYAPRFRHLLLTHQVLGNVPTIVFVRDKENAKIQEVERLLAVADFGEDYDGLDIDSSGVFREIKTLEDTYSPPTSMFGIDHVELNSQIMDYKNKLKDRAQETDNNGLSQHLQEQLAEIRRQKVLKKKMKKKTMRLVDDITPQKYLLDKYSDLNSEGEEEVSREHLEDEVSELEEEEEEKSSGPLGECRD